MDIRHDVALTMALSVAVVAASLLTWAACHWLYGRKLLAAAHRLHRSEKERAFSRDQTLQARRQVEQLKTELEAQQRHASAQSRTEARQRAVQQADERATAERSTTHESGFMPIVAAHGFADTQILPE